MSVMHNVDRIAPPQGIVLKCWLNVAKTRMDMSIIVATSRLEAVGFSGTWWSRKSGIRNMAVKWQLWDGTGIRMQGHDRKILGCLLLISFTRKAGNFGSRFGFSRRLDSGMGWIPVLFLQDFLWFRFICEKSIPFIPGFKLKSGFWWSTGFQMGWKPCRAQNAALIENGVCDLRFGSPSHDFSKNPWLLDFRFEKSHSN